MSGVIKDSAIKLFGKTIVLSPERILTASSHLQESQSLSSSTTSTSHDDKSSSDEELSGIKQEDDSTNPTAVTVIEPTSSSDMSSSPKTMDKDSLSEKSCNKEEPSANSVPGENTLKKPDKILPCPRCNSMETKFCYYNNYNVNQPRHFCKICQRYWTAGGTMRNVPVGSGRRKNKNASASNYHQIIVSDAFQAAQAIAIAGMHFPSVEPKGTVLMFGAESPLSEPMASAIDLLGRTENHVKHGFCGSEKRNPVHRQRKEIANSHSSGSSGFSPVFYPAMTNLGCTLPRGWNAPWLSHPPLSKQSNVSVNRGSPTLRKHSREGNIIRPPVMEIADVPREKVVERRVLIPKTLRLDDPNVSAKSSIWSSLGIKKEKTNSALHIFSALPAKGNSNDNVDGTSLVLQANPAALSRSLNFRESV